MSVKIVRWQCEICGHEHESEEAAVACEALGMPEIFYKVGQQFYATAPGRSKADRTINKNAVWTLVKVNVYRHSSGTHLVNYKFTRPNARDRTYGIHYVQHSLVPIEQIK